MNPDPASQGYTDYAYSLALGWLSGGGGIPKAPIRLAAMTQPSLTVMNLEHVSTSAVSWLAGKGATNCSTCTPGLAVIYPQAIRHFDGTNILFCDGHVKWRKHTSISAREYGLNKDTLGDTSGSAKMDTNQITR